MSLHRPGDTPRATVDDAQARTWALLSARARGCTCLPEITVNRPTGRVAYVTVAHDAGCPAAEQGAA